ncbi:short-chain dehydrogenase/reductase SDR (plasmid) [Cupriavidus necator N-1]|uniref:Short-chain dehydrogenase/reductase SDR n=1 Tax=Cupriavidus necator (strain ATCC 43291 / DSM 13513 / CCUG 52238 / LMG 8453 / N-1) TaxID=1042878 RepID=F8GWB4_CUPNN|nr:short-chain dehydrogenase/reductase SDR [Cupriavidus necator N-1]
MRSLIKQASSVKLNCRHLNSRIQKGTAVSNSKVVVITGVSSGIGRATAAKFAQQGYRVFGTVRNSAKAQPISGVELVEMDIRDEASVQHGIQAIIAHAKRIDVLVNSAGVTLLGSTEETSIAEAQSLFDTNVFGILRTTQAVLPHMRAQRSGRIVNISSVLGFLPAPYMGLYSASKHAVEGMSETLDHEVRKFGIRVVLVEPSFTKTGLDTNAPHAASKISAYDDERNIVLQAIQKNVKDAPDPDGVATTIVDAAVGAWGMRRPPKGQAYLLSKLRRFMPAGPVDASLRKTFGLS